MSWNGWCSYTKLSTLVAYFFPQLFRSIYLTLWHRILDTLPKQTNGDVDFPKGCHYLLVFSQWWHLMATCVWFDKVHFKGQWILTVSIHQHCKWYICLHCIRYETNRFLQVNYLNDEKDPLDVGPLSWIFYFPPFCKLLIFIKSTTHEWLTLLGTAETTGNR
jgi:hypothetical protein